MDGTAWKSCSTCKKDIPFGADYYVCNVSTCNRKGTDFRFCRIECWEAHLPMYRHRESWAVDKRAPSQATAEAESQADETALEEREARAVERTEPTPIVQQGEIPDDILVVVSKLKAYVRARSGMKTSDNVMPVLSEKIRALCDAAVHNASQAGRKTILDRDF